MSAPKKAWLVTRSGRYSHYVVPNGGGGKAYCGMNNIKHGWYSGDKPRCPKCEALLDAVREIIEGRNP